MRWFLFDCRILRRSFYYLCTRFHCGKCGCENSWRAGLRVWSHGLRGYALHVSWSNNLPWQLDFPAEFPIINGRVLWIHSYVIGAFTSWHTQALFCGIIPLAFHVLMLCVPESPRYLVEIGDHERAGQALSWLYGLSQKDVQDDLKEVKKAWVTKLCSRGKIDGILMRNLHYFCSWFKAWNRARLDQSRSERL